MNGIEVRSGLEGEPAAAYGRATLRHVASQHPGRFRRWSLCVALLTLAPVVATSGRAQSIPAGTYLNVRLRHPLYSYSAKRGQPVRAVLIAPIVLDGIVRLPAGTDVRGQITDVRRVGLGVRRERARLGLRFDTAVLPTGERLPLDARLRQVLNAREKLDDEGRITGIRATATLGYQMSGWLVGATAGDPLLMLFALAGSTAVVRFAESEIVLPAGTELLLQTAAPLALTRAFPAPVRALAQNAQEKRALGHLVARLPFRTSTPAGKPSDLTNVLLIGDAAAIERAFHAAGWSDADELNATTAYRTFRSMAESRGYAEAPMSLLQLNGRSPYQTWQKGLNTFSARHHLRMFSSEARWKEQPVWPISSTEDIGIGFSRKSRHFIHLIDPTIDNERNKVVNDLTFTGCVEAVDLVPRPFVPRNARNATNDPLLTDGDIAVVQLNACLSPRPLFEPASDVPVGLPLGNPVQRGFRRLFLSLKHQMWRGNIVAKGVSYAAKGVKLLFGRPAPPEPAERTLTIDGVPYTVAEEPAAPLLAPRTMEDTDTSIRTRTAPEPRAQRTRPLAAASRPLPTVELFMGPAARGAESPGTLAMGLAAEGASPQSADDLRLVLTTPVRVDRGAGVAASVTLHAARRLSHEISYDYSRANLRFDFTRSRLGAYLGDGTLLVSDSVALEPVTARLAIRSLGYTLQAHVRRRGARVRPYVVAGPELTAYTLRDASGHNSRLLGRLGLSNVASIVGAVRAGRKPLIDGGTIYRWGLTYGGGVHIRLTSTIGVKLDARETLIGTPDFASLDPEDLQGAGRVEFAEETKRVRRRAIVVGGTFSF